MSSTARLHVESFFDPATFTFSHIAWDASTGHCALIDSVLDYDPKSGRTDTASADHLSSAPYLQRSEFQQHLSSQVVQTHHQVIQTLSISDPA
jgi:hypothetical protein